METITLNKIYSEIKLLRKDIKELKKEDLSNFVNNLKINDKLATKKEAKEIGLEFWSNIYKIFSKIIWKINKKKNLINLKLKLLKNISFRFKALKFYKNTFEIKIIIENNYSRLIYVVYLPKVNEITIFGIFKREKAFKDFKHKFEIYFK